MAKKSKVKRVELNLHGGPFDGLVIPFGGPGEYLPPSYIHMCFERRAFELVDESGVPVLEEEFRDTDDKERHHFYGCKEITLSDCGNVCEIRYGHDCDQGPCNVEQDEIDDEDDHGVTF